MADSVVRSGIYKKQNEVASFLLKLGTASQASVLSGDLHLNEAMYGFALLFNMGTAHQQRSIFEEGMLAH
jgi:hypothetical protein